MQLSDPVCTCNIHEGATFCEKKISVNLHILWLLKTSLLMQFECWADVSMFCLSLSSITVVDKGPSRISSPVYVCNTVSKPITWLQHMFASLIYDTSGMFMCTSYQYSLACFLAHAPISECAPLLVDRGTCFSSYFSKRDFTTICACAKKHDYTVWMGMFFKRIILYRHSSDMLNGECSMGSAQWRALCTQISKVNLSAFIFMKQFCKEM